ncbi:helix-turn-helix domain-containing protein [Rossellomorea marisflavi]|jgi:transcriptional regulator with XRE-family HTH domain|uniref:helix-turn-helix domain-containing protein n=2 Tax=Rossellomorea marisflavi TaxID=189381 RepID=UPI00203F0692|nr:helix-turn-helix transcriptional regulator [Rossellomorea marisflavi]MCM2606934.1 helix-turn-helix domain-containing protein [Rossellomorea marisflavi]MDR4935516.1 helix-turn-helix transcriptional regulator [Rossellomorea marisflavi]USK91484.1 helix-turn-helix domain-containing protein [Rossellomorea marisflavi]WJV19675.1 helix-turn-helix transcriptional regulator [Rossellomorea marisflavi]
MEIEEVIGRKIRSVRRAKEITLKELSNLTGISINYLSAIEQGKANPSLKKVDIILFHLEMNWEELFLPIAQYQMKMKM